MTRYVQNMHRNVCHPCHFIRMIVLCYMMVLMQNGKTFGNGVLNVREDTNIGEMKEYLHKNDGAESQNESRCLTVEQIVELKMLLREAKEYMRSVGQASDESDEKRDGRMARFNILDVPDGDWYAYRKLKDIGIFIECVDTYADLYDALIKKMDAYRVWLEQFLKRVEYEVKYEKSKNMSVIRSLRLGSHGFDEYVKNIIECHNDTIRYNMEMIKFMNIMKDVNIDKYMPIFREIPKVLVLFHAIKSGFQNTCLDIPCVKQRIQTIFDSIQMINCLLRMTNNNITILWLLNAKTVDDLLNNEECVEMHVKYRTNINIFIEGAKMIPTIAFNLL